MSYRKLSLLFLSVSIALSAAPERQRYAVYFGGSEADVATAVAVDADGSAYVAGQMTQPGGKKSAFLTKTKGDGSEVLWTSKLDGGIATAVALDGKGGVWVAGDGFVAKVNGESGQVDRTLESEYVHALAVDLAGGVYTAGDGWVIKYTGFEKAYTAKIAGIAHGIAVDGQGAAYVASGHTVTQLAADGSAGYTADLGWAGAAIAVDGMGSAYVTGAGARVAKLTPAGDGLMFSTVLEGVLEQEGHGIALDAAGNIYVAGWTQSSDFARARGWHGARDGFVVMLNAAGELMDTTFVGTAGQDSLQGLAVTPRGDVYVAGWTEGAGLGSGPLAQLQGGTDGILMKFAGTGERALTGTTTALVAAPASPVALGTAVTLTAVVSPAGATGKVSFFAGAVPLGSATMSGTTAVFATSVLPAGNYLLRAVYTGDVNYSASTSPAVTFGVNTTPSLTFSAVNGTTTAVGAQPIAVATADFNKDGRTDVAVANTTGNSVSVLLSNGAGGFTAAGPALATGAGPNGITTGDFNEDGNPDFATANTNTNNVTIYLGNGAGGFTVATPAAMLGGPFGIVAADVNRDGHTDLLTANFASGSMGVLLGNGLGGFTPGTAVNTGGQASHVAVADFNNDGSPDVAVTNFSGNTVSLYLGNGLGGFTAGAGSPVATGAGPVTIAVGDYNSDGLADVATANFASGNVTILAGNGSGGLTAMAGSPVATGGSPRWITALDYNGDGKMDLALASSSTNSVIVMQGAGNGSFTAAQGSPFAGHSSASGIAAGDFKGDGRVDLAIVNAGSNSVRTLLGVGAVPLVVSATPPSPTTTPQTISLLTRDADGFANIARVYFLINTTPTIPQNSCHGFYERANNSFYLYNDAISVLSGPLAAGSGGTLQNSQCILYGSGSGLVSGAGTDLSVNLRMGMLGLYSTTTENIYFWAVDEQNLGTGWVQTGSWVLGAPVGDQAPTVVSGSPANPSNSPQTFSFTVRDLNGSANLDRIYFLVNATPTIPVNTCHGFFDRATNAVYLYNDAVTLVTGPLTLGAAGTLQNSQCSVNGMGSELISGAGTDVTINLNMSLLGSYATSTQSVYVWVTDKQANGTGWVKTSTWGLNSGPQPPTLVSATPANPSGSPQTFTLLTRDPNGFADISRLYWVVNSTPTVPVNSCHGFYDRASGAFYLFNDALNAVLGPVAPGSVTTVSNSQCTLHGAGSTVTGSGTDLTATVQLSLSQSYGAGAQKLYVWVVDNAQTGTGWVLASNWGGSTAPAAPTLVSVVPGVSAQATQIFTVTARDTNGHTDINRVYFVINTNPSVPTGSCHGFYDRAANAVALFNDNLTSLTAFTVGTAGTVQNSQCSINGTGTTVTASGNDIVLNLNMTRQGSYATGAKNLYFWVVDNAQTGTGWVAGSNWTL